MKVPMSWFNDYTDITGITPKEYSNVLTMTGSKVEGYENLGANIDKVVVGKIEECVPHPDSDHMVVCQVNVGAEENLQIVCGAPNAKAGIKVIVALDGSTLPGGKIKKGKLRGVVSNGMLCSADEIGLSEADLGYVPEYGILILNDDAKLGQDIKEYFGINDSVIEYEITSNRPDCFSVIGLARETAASFKKPFSVKTPKFNENTEDINDTVSVDVQNTQKCMRYTSRMIKNVKIAPSPKWMRDRLNASGIRAINNIVDITNYVLLEYGQPMHAFDLRDLHGGKIIVRSAKDGEVVKTLDEQDHTMSSSDLVIADADRIVAVAGVMGGFNSEIKPDTETVVFESATFDGASVRLSAQKLGLRTEASSRYEKGLDPNNTLSALERACELVELLGAGEIVGGCIDKVQSKREPKVIDFRPDKLNAFLGTDISTDDMVSYLKPLEIDVDLKAMKLTVPTFRPDVVAEADVAEEIARFYGYDVIPTTLLRGDTTAGKRNDVQLARDRINQILIAQGAYEIYTYTFTSPTIFDKLRIANDSPLRTTVKILNPLGEDTSIMRTTTLSSMLEVLSRNYNYRNESAKLFEIGKVFLPVDGEALPTEKEVITIGMYGNGDFFVLKGMVEALCEGLNAKRITYIADSNNPSYHPGRCANIYFGKECIGTLGEIHPTVSSTYGIDKPTYIAEIDFKALLGACNNNVKYKELPRFPAVNRDIAMLIDKSVPSAQITTVIKKAAGNNLESIALFDVYEGSQIPEGKKSIAYSLTYRTPERSLTNDEVNASFDKIVEALGEKFNADLR